ncbi:MAG: PKD domain-containing protein [Candidatus Hydrogenedentes bacterium]|nr:PKD domain-containing protein [Candidatus Hydrogenedentota bacterium]
MKSWLLNFGFRIGSVNAYAIFFAAGAFVLVSAAYGQGQAVEIKSQKPGEKSASETKTDADKKSEPNGDNTEPKTDEKKALEEQSLAQRLQALDVRERLAQLMLVTLEGTPGPNASDREFMLRYAPGGVIIPKVLYPITACDYVTKLRSMPLEAMTGIPMLIGTNLYSLPRPAADELPTTFVPMPSLLALAAANDPDITQRVSVFAANHLKAMGFNFHLGPSLAFAPTLPEIKGSLDCLGSDPRFVADSSNTILKTFEENGILALPMGFPGGALNKKGQGPAVLLTPAALLEDEDLLPFKRAIEQGTSIIHVGNILTPTLSKDDLPASMSSAIMRDLLREKLGFKGVIVAGPMDAQEIALNYDPSVAAEKALAAGADMLLWNQAGRRVMRAVDQIVAGISERRIPQETVDAALERVMRLKEEEELAGRPMPVPKEAEALSRKRDLPKEVYEIERRSIALVQNRGDILPLNKTKSMPVGITGVVGVDPLKEALSKYLKHVSSHEIATARHGGEIYDFEIDRITKRISGLRTMVLILTPDIRVSTQARLINAIQARGVVVVAVLVGYPDTLPKISGAEAIVLSYCRPTQMDLSMKAVADVLVGQAPIGVSPYLSEIKTAVGKTESYSVLDVVRAPSGMLPVTIEPPYIAGLSVPYDPTFSLTKTLWEFGDGTKSKEIRAEHAFKAAGRYPITLTVEDKKDHSTTRTFYAVVE